MWEYKTICDIYVTEDKFLEHSRTKGSKNGIRRYQNADGTWTPLGLARRREREGFGEGGESSGGKKSLRSRIFSKKKSSSDTAEEQKEETVEEKRQRLLNSTNPKELYENRSLLTTNEINDRINRIDKEAKLKELSESGQAQTGLDKVNSMMRKGKDTVDNAVGIYKSVEGAYNLLKDSSMGKDLMKKLGLEPPKKAFDIVEVAKNASTMTTQELKDAVSKNSYIDTLKKAAREAEKQQNADKIKEAAQKTVDDYNKKWAEENGSTTYSKKGSDIIDNKVGTGNTNPNIPRLPGPAEKVSGKVEGTGRSNGGFKDNSKVVDAKEGVDYTFVSGNSKVSDVKNTASYSTGKNETTRLLETIGNKPLLLEDKGGK